MKGQFFITVKAWVAAEGRGEGSLFTFRKVAGIKEQRSIEVQMHSFVACMDATTLCHYHLAQHNPEVHMPFFLQGRGRMGNPNRWGIQWAQRLMKLSETKSIGPSEQTMGQE